MPPNALPPRATLVLLALAAALWLLRLADQPLLGPDEPRYVRVAIEMQRAGEWVRPTLQGAPWLEKPPLYYWLAGAAFRRLGENELAARLPAVAAGLLLVGATAIAGARLCGAAAGLHAGFVLATSLLVFAFARAATMDMLLAATVTAGLALVGLRLLGIAGPPAIPAGYAFFGLAVLAKGPIGILVPGAVVLAYLLATREWRRLRELFAPAALIAFCAVAPPWYLLAWRDQGRHFIDVFFLNHNLQRFTSTVHNHPGPFWYYLPVLLAGLFPWSGLLLPALASLRPRRARADLFLLCWLLVPLVFFSSAGSKLPGYILPCLAPLALLAGRAAAALQARDAKPAAAPRVVALVGLALGALLFTVPFLLRARGEPGWTALVPACTWALLSTFLASRAFDRPAVGLRLLRTGGAGLLALLALGAPELLARLESGRDLFRTAQGREVLAFGAWRTAWMAGYFYNDARVREVPDLPAVAAAAASGPVLVLCGPGERRQILHSPGFVATLVAEGPRRNALLEVRRR